MKLTGEAALARPSKRSSRGDDSSEDESVGTSNSIILMVLTVGVLNGATTATEGVVLMRSIAGTLLGVGESSLIISMTSAAGVGVGEGTAEMESDCARV